ncbi:MAG: insulinase family protein, partial [Deltaproteobacteria bacterium]|nr:insulinase family protein [Deltaproteobacteria bacterium]
MHHQKHPLIRRTRWSVALFALTVLLAISAYGQVCAGQDPDQAVKQGIGDAAIDRIIPSKTEDLFVILKNGLTVLIRESHASKAVSCQVLVKTGSIYEGSRMGAGLSHYLEHVVSGGSTSRNTEAEIRRKVEALGGATNAYTTYDHTVYFINTTGDKVRTALELLLSYVTDCRFDETEYRREKKVILQEFQLGENDPLQQLWRAFISTAYREHPVRFPIIGKGEIFTRMDKQALMAHYRRWYTPENIVVAVVGDVKKDQALEAVLQWTAGLERTESSPYVLPAEPRQVASRRVEKAMPIARLTSVLMGFRTITLTDPDLYALDVLAVILGDGRTSLLYRRVRDEKGLALSITATSWTPQFVEGQFTVSMRLRDKDLPGALDTVWQVINGVKKDGVDEQALKRAKNKMTADHIFGSESVQEQASQLASDWVATGDPYFSDHYVEALQKVTRQQVQQVAKQYLLPDRMTLAVVKPPQGGIDKPGVQGRPAVLSKVEKRILPNQMTLLLKRVTTVPIVCFDFVVNGGLRFEPADQVGISRFMASLLTKGTKRRSKLEIARALEDVGGAIRAQSGRNTAGVFVSVLKAHFDRALDVLADVVLHPTFPEEEIKKQREDTLLAIQRLDERWTTEISRMFNRHYYRKHPYRNDVLGKPETVRTFTRADIRAFYEKIMKANNAVLAVFGDIDPDAVASKVEAAFEAFSPGILEQPLIQQENENIQEDATFVTHNEKTSAAILVGYNGLTLKDPDVPAADVLDAVISGVGYPSGWLYEALRGGKQSLVYYIHAYPAFGVDGGYFGVMTQTTPDNY